MKPGKSRARWDPTRSRKVESYTFWKRRYGTRDEKTERWKVTARFEFENGNGETFAVRIHCFGGPNNGRTRNMSEARLLQLFKPTDP